MAFSKSADHPEGELHIEERSAVGPRSDGGGPRARTLKEWRSLLPGLGHSIKGPTGKEFPISLDQFEGRDENTPIAIYVTWVDPKKVGTKDPTGKPGPR